MGDSKGRWWILSAWLAIGIGVVGFGVALFSLYGIYLGPISHEHAAWSSFGSLLSGFFMVASTGATVATLLFLAHQNKQIQKTNTEQQRVTNAQLAALNFEQYVNHRRFFMERLGELQSMFGDKFVFENGDALYNKVFPKNSPTNLEFTAEVVTAVGSRNYLGTLNNHLSELSELSKNPDWANSGGRRLMGNLTNLSETLNLRMVNDVSDGDFVFGGRRTAINIYSADEFVFIAKAIYDSLMFYTGNPNFVGFDFPMGRSATDSLMKYFLKDKSSPEVIQVLKPLPGLEIIEKIYLNLCDIDELYFHYFQPTYAVLIDVFSSRVGVEKLRNKVFLEDMVDMGGRSAARALSQAAESDNDYDKLKQTHEYFNIMLDLNR
ncbi:hypothetical protein V0M98_01320 [Pseudomonas silesiensis]|uniref:hypothetical protein n=1 Tax=Pseudomonas silesiensis TaxID=1853130 RepID=UPI0030CE935A